MKLEYPFRLIRHHQCAHAVGILRAHTRWAVAGVAGLRLQATQRKHKATCGITPIGTHRDGAGDVECGNDFP